MLGFVVEAAVVVVMIVGDVVHCVTFRKLLGEFVCERRNTFHHEGHEGFG
jgi:hypothetical protein